MNCPPQRYITNNQLKAETKTSFSGSSSPSPRPRCIAVPVLKYFAQLPVVRRQAIHVDYVKVFPISIVEPSQGCVSDCGSDSVGGEEYSANIFVRSPLPYLSTVGIVQAFFAMEEALLTLHISHTNFLVTPLLIKLLWREMGFQCHGSSQSLEEAQAPSRRVLGKDLLMNL